MKLTAVPGRFVDPVLGVIAFVGTTFGVTAFVGTTSGVTAFVGTTFGVGVGFCDGPWWGWRF